MPLFESWLIGFTRIATRYMVPALVTPALILPSGFYPHFNQQLLQLELAGQLPGAGNFLPAYVTVGCILIILSILCARRPPPAAPPKIFCAALGVSYLVFAAGSLLALAAAIFNDLPVATILEVFEHGTLIYLAGIIFIGTRVQISN